MDGEISEYIEINLIGIKKIIEMSWMFAECLSLSSLSDISKWNTSHVNNISSIFYECPLSSLPDISKWDTSNVKDISYMLDGCSSLFDISKCDISNVIKLSYMFHGYSSLLSLPDI